MNLAMETLEARRSVRSFSGYPLASGDRALIEGAIRGSGPCPFGTTPRFVLVEPHEVGAQASGRIGTYGVIKDAPAFIAGAVTPGPFVFADFGFALEGILLTAVSGGLGTCWLGGTFDRSGVVRALHLAGDEIVPAISPVGEPSERRTLADSAIRALAGSRNRKPWDRLFFDGTFGHALSAADAGPWAAALEAVRRGPSASNKQPWRLVRTGSVDAPGFHLFLDEDAVYNNAIKGIRLQELDIGIAMRHFEVAARAGKLPGSWTRLDEVPVQFGSPMVYYASWVVR
jgi:nitroreductase